MIHENVITAEEFRKHHDKVYQWLDSRIGKFANLKGCAIFYKEDENFRIRLFTDNYVYAIVVSDSYIGGFMGNRKYDIGENWTRGNDILDGEYSEETIQGIVNDIFSCELLSTTQFYKDLL